MREWWGRLGGLRTGGTTTCYEQQTGNECRAASSDANAALPSAASPASGPADGCSGTSGPNRDCCYYFASQLSFNPDGSVSITQDSCSHCLGLGVCPTSNSYTGTPKGLWTCSAGGSTDSYNGLTIHYCKAALTGGGIALVVVLVVVGVAGCAGLAVFVARRRSRAMQAQMMAGYPAVQMSGVGMGAPQQYTVGAAAPVAYTMAAAQHPYPPSTTMAPQNNKF